MADYMADMTSSPATAASQRQSTSPATPAGLSGEDAGRRLAEFGPNDPAPVKRAAAFAELAALFANPLVLILLAASFISFLLGNAGDATIILVVVFLGVILNFAQTFRSHRAVDRLREHVAATATLLRDGAWQEVNRREVVPGDIVKLSAGDMIPADGILLSSRDLYVQEAALTGESLPVEKNAIPGASMADGLESPSAVFLGTSVVSGTAIAEIRRTGPRTQFGAVAERLAARPRETEFEYSMKRFSLLILRAVTFLVLFIVGTRVALHKDAFESFVFAVALAVGLTPEFLPMITSVTLARGAVRMARDQVIVKHLPAIQNFGTMDVLCTDKTGTLTTGKMELNSSVDCKGTPSDRVLFLAGLNSNFETGIRSPLDDAILRASPGKCDLYAKCDEIPFDFERRRLSIVVREKGSDGGGWRLITKGAPEAILALSESCEVEGRTIPLDASARQVCDETFRGLSDQGFRVLGVAWRDVTPSERYTAQDEQSLVFAGFLAFADPPHPDASAALEAMKRDGVQVKILSGDNEIVAAHVCRQVGLDPGEIILGQELNNTTDTALQHLAEQTTVFARVSPMQKHRIINSLRSRGHVVGYLGDGINDAASLRAADVGVSVASAVDVARDAAEIILLTPGLAILHKGIIEGRRASANVLKYMLMGTSSNFGNMFSMAGASTFLPFLPMLPTQILLNNFLYDLSQVTIPSDNVDEEYLREPRRWNMKLVRRFMIFIGPISSLYDFLTFFVLLAYFHAGQAEFHTGWFIESLATQTLVIFVIRTARNPLKSRPSLPLALTTVAVVIFGVLVAYLPFAKLLGFTPLPGPFYGFLAVSIATYLALVEIAKRALFRAHGAVPRIP
jgi:Mg2+-importing ATPase